MKTLWNGNQGTATQASQFERREKVKDFAYGTIYLISAITSVALLVLCYQSGTCTPTRRIVGLTMNCQNPQSSLAINFALPFFAIAAIIKARDLFTRALQE